MSHCPSETQLHSFLADSATHDEAQWIEEHVETCEACQQTLGRLVDAGPNVALPHVVLASDTEGDVAPNLVYRLVVALCCRLSVRGMPPRLARVAERRQPLFALGTRLMDHYTVLEKVASGDMGEVYRVRDDHLGRVLAMKLMRPELRGHTESERRFLREARITGRLQHPNIVPIHELGCLPPPDDLPYYTMKLVEGENLEAILARTVASRSQADLRLLLRILEAVFDAVAFAHEQSVIHRDLKPANVMVGKKGDAIGEVQVMDWGLAKLFHFAAGSDVAQDRVAEGVLLDAPRSNAVQPSQSLHTVEGRLLGTLLYMPPEQVQDASRADKSSDVFALGAMLLEVLTGAPPCLELNEYRQLQALRIACREQEARLGTLRNVCGVEEEQLEQAQKELERAMEALNRWYADVNLQKRVENVPENTAPGIARLRKMFLEDSSDKLGPITAHLVPLVEHCLLRAPQELVPQDASEVKAAFAKYGEAVRHQAEQMLSERASRTQAERALAAEKEVARKS